ncbi:PAS domain-containing sensor histidine kinase [Pseudobdellovibrio exovorus]|uniref:histidine kinase n=1 Tax=Pseudobdellovibrio exovorus JSS TaxID=1184267 RepID=M4VQJ4_9BACT|nr:ATP-binding protein [Pseudobdellovibrio exovorus]AGH95429.1 hypothetical protein A11Q_1213 [Pseudobdellovibrio exovorus JSS]
MWALSALVFLLTTGAFVFQLKIIPERSLIAIQAALILGLLCLFWVPTIFSQVRSRSNKSKTEKESHQRREFLEKLFSSLEEVAIISVADQSGKIIFANRQFCKISGYSVDELIGQDHRIVNSGYHPSDFFKTMWMTIKNGDVWQGEVKNLKKEGGYYWVKTYVVPLFDPERNMNEYVSFRFDITSEKEFEEIYRQEHLKNIHMNRLAALGEMVGTTAHEINNPMAAIGAYLSFMSKCLKSEDVTQYSDELNDNIIKARIQIQRILKIINGLREFVRSGENIEAEVVSLQSIIENAVTLCSGEISKKNVTVKVDIQETIVRVNPVQLEQVFVNLIMNALDAVATLQDKWIEINSRWISDQTIEVRVVDSGFGIDAKVAERIMLPFFSTKNKGSGTGLGLSISRGIVEQQNGQLYLDQKSPNTAFVIRLPIYLVSSSHHIEDLIGHHIRHRQKIIELLNSNFIIDPESGFEEVVADIGKWYEAIEQGYRQDPNFVKIQKLYPEFIQSVRSLLKRSQSNDRTVVYDAAQGSSSSYDLQSRKIVSCLQAFKSVQIKSHVV